MRLRRIKGADETVANSPYAVQPTEQQAGAWNTLFKNTQPIHIEIGMGKGQFLYQLAKENPQINYIGIERYTSVIIKALKRMEEEPLPNLLFICMDAANLEQFFAAGEIQRIYLNFSDPWPKDRHAKRRLTSVEFLKRYNTILAPDGHIEFKTDNEGLFDFSLESVQEGGWKLLASTRDLHHDPDMNSGNIMTEYEEKFSAQGNPIFKLIAAR